MKITAIKTFLVTYSYRPRALIKVETDEGLCGWGEAYSIGPDLSVEPIVNYIATWFVGEDPRRIEYLMMKTHQQFRFPPGVPAWPPSPGLNTRCGISAAKRRTYRYTCFSAATCATA